jgi:hypothetical protein
MTAFLWLTMRNNSPSFRIEDASEQDKPMASETTINPSNSGDANPCADSTSETIRDGLAAIDEVLIRIADRLAELLKTARGESR